MMATNVGNGPAAGIVEPAALASSVTGQLRGRTGSYDKHLADLDGIYRDGKAYQQALDRLGPDWLAYRVEENQVGSGPGALITGTSTLFPLLVGGEFAMTRGHLHVRADRAELYYCVAGSGVMLMETLTGEHRAIPMNMGDAVHVPGHWIHRSVNVGDEPLVTIFCYPADAGHDYGVISDAGGMSRLVIADADSWTTHPNPGHRGDRVG
jgi:glucose-6-phosphate isomerase